MEKDEENLVLNDETQERIRDLLETGTACVIEFDEKVKLFKIKFVLFIFFLSVVV